MYINYALSVGDSKLLELINSSQRNRFAAGAGRFCANCWAQYGGCDSFSRPPEAVQDPEDLLWNPSFLDAYVNESWRGLQ
ncbi:hypothetical protein KBC31_00150 [Candidatus Saccharibacteria bacterium]|jgi:hypothetical protein|nr:hypothetical protein [Candidatus Saccharibacteria bacterium]